MRGETAPIRKHSSKLAGPPPHAWGNHSALSALFSIRNTPTCVGKTLLHGRVVVLVTEHPHMRGETTAT